MACSAPVKSDGMKQATDNNELEEEDGSDSVATPTAKRRKFGKLSLSEQDKDANTKSLVRSSNIIWVDLEMTGLDVNKDFIMEMACIITDKNIEVVAEGPNLVVHHSDEVLERMGEWCTLQHHKTGLTQMCRDSKLSCEDVELQMLQFVSNYCPKGRCEIAGNSIHNDRLFLEKHMPRFFEMLHYRIIDVSTIRNIGWRWYRDFEKYPSDGPTMTHRALDDIKCSIALLRFYRETVFKSEEQYTSDMCGTKELEDEGGFDDVLSYYETTKAKENDGKCEKLSKEELHDESKRTVDSQNIEK